MRTSHYHRFISSIADPAHKSSKQECGRCCWTWFALGQLTEWVLKYVSEYVGYKNILQWHQGRVSINDFSGQRIPDFGSLKSKWCFTSAAVVMFTLDARKTELSRTRSEKSGKCKGGAPSWHKRVTLCRWSVASSGCCQVEMYRLFDWKPVPLYQTWCSMTSVFRSNLCCRSILNISRKILFDAVAVALVISGSFTIP